MAKDQALAFLKKLWDDKAFAADVKKLKGDELAKFVKSSGFQFTHEEYQAAMKEAAAKYKLSDELLDQVAGGYCPSYDCPDGYGCSPSCYSRWH